MGQHRIIPIVFLLGTAGAAAEVAAAPGDVVNVGTFGGPHSEAYGINNQGVVVGRANDASQVFHPFRYVGGTRQDLGLMQGLSTAALDISENGIITGNAFVAATTTQAFRYNFNGGSYEPLGTLGGARSSGHGVNSAGSVVGSAELPGGARRAFLYAGQGAMQSLGTLGTGGYSSAFAINDDGVIVGESETLPGADVHAFRYTAAGGMQDLGLPPGAPANGSSYGLAISNTGIIVGQASKTGGGHRAYRWTQAGGMEELLALGAIGSGAGGVNDRGDAVGLWGTPSGDRAALWLPDGIGIDLDGWLNLVNPVDGPKWILQEALDINNAGIIVGYGEFNDGPGGASDGLRGFILDASSLVPEPGSFVTVTVVLTGFAFARRRRDRP